MQTTNTPNSPSSPTASAIATAAYYQWVKAGKPPGRDMEFWLKAESEVKNGGKTTSPGPRAVAPRARATSASTR